MQWHKPNLSQQYPWQAKLAASIVLLLLGLHNISAVAFISQIRELKNNVLEITSTSFNKTYQDVEFQLTYPPTWQAQEELDGVMGDMAKILLSDNREVQLTINIRNLASEPLSLEGWRQQLLEFLKYDNNLTVTKQKNATLALRQGYEIACTTTDKGKTYKKVVITALKNNKAYSAIYSAPEDLFYKHEAAAREMINSLKLSS